MINQYRRTDGHVFEAEIGSVADNMMAADSIFELIVSGVKAAQAVSEVIKEAKGLAKSQKPKGEAAEAKAKAKE